MMNCNFENSAVVGGLAGVRGVREGRGKGSVGVSASLFFPLFLIETDTRAQE